MLCTRMPWLRIDGPNYPIEYLHHGMRFAIPHISPNTAVSFHFVVAYNRSESGSDSHLFAVDVPHAIVKSFAISKLIHGSVTG